jgi:DNA-binding MarR family transcriptional regulator
MMAVKQTIGILIHQTDLMLTHAVKDVLEPFDLSTEQQLIMQCLWQQEGITQKDIAKQLFKDQPNITRMLCNLEKKEMIYRITPENNRRVSQVYLTDKGKAVRDEVIYATSNLCERIHADLSESELAQLEQLLLRIQRNIRQL